MRVKQRNFILFGLCLLLSVMFLLPQIRFQNPNLLDVAETWSFGTNIIQNVSAEFLNSARFRPMYAFQRSLLNALFTYHAPLYFFSFAVIFATTLFLFYRILKPQRKLLVTYGWICAVLLISPVTIDTYWRLGTAENFFTLALLFSVYYFIRSRYLGTVMWLFVLMGSKETAAFYIPIFIILLGIKKRYGELILLCIGYVWYLTKMYQLVSYALITQDSYTSLFTSSYKSVWDMFVYYITSYVFYFSLFLISLGLFLYRIWFGHRVSRQQQFEWGYVHISLIIGGFCSLLFFHNKFQPYYMFPLMISILIFMASELVLTTLFFRKIVLLYGTLLFFVMAIPQTAFVRAQYWQRDYAGDNALIELIEKTKDTNIYAFDRAYRPELIPALHIITENQSIEKDNRQKYSILLKKGSLCGKTFFGEQACKWSVGRL